MFVRTKAIRYGQLERMLDSGISITEALRVLAGYASGGGRLLFNSMADVIEIGGTFTDALVEQRRHFSDMEIGILRAGEVSGTIAESCRTLADYFEHTWRRIIIAALMFAIPLLIVHVVVIVVPIPMTLMGGGSLVEGFQNSIRMVLVLWTILVILFVILPRVHRRLASSVKLGLHRVLLAIPGLGSVLRRFALARFATTFSVCYRAGVPVLPALELAKDVAGNAVIAQAGQGVMDAVESGKTVTEAFRAAGGFPREFVAILDSGERSGKMDEALTEASGRYLREAGFLLLILVGLGAFSVYGGYVLYMVKAIIALWGSIYGAGGMIWDLIE